MDSITKKCIVVTGMHRSGTSALMGVLNILGIDLGFSYLNPKEDNPKGFFENISISNINEKILKSLNSSWDDVFFLPENWWNSEHLFPYKEEIIQIIKHEFNEKTIFGIKDPRISRLLPLWNDIFKELSIEPYYIISLRNPLEIAMSLKMRNGFSNEKSMILWMVYMLDAEIYSRNFKRIFITFDELLRNVKDVILKISNVFNVAFPKTYHDVKRDLERFLDPNLKHYTFSQEKSFILLEPIQELYFLLLSLTKKDAIEDKEIEKLEKIKDSFLKTYKYFYNEDIKNYIQHTNILKNEIEDLEEQNNNLEFQLETILNSRGWRFLTKYYKLRDFILPKNSKRKLFLTSISKNIILLTNNFIFRNAIKSIEIVRYEGLRTLFRKVKKKIKEKMLKLLIFRNISSLKLLGDINKYDVIFFTIIDWNFRYQRPQQIAVRFANAGHRVFYISSVLRKQKSYTAKQITKNIYEIVLPFRRDSVIYKGDLYADIDKPREALKEIFRDFSIKESIAIVEFPSWYPLVAYLSREYGTKIIFDCLDEYSGFHNIHKNINQIENELLKLSDYCFTTSLKLFEKQKNKCRNIAIIRNGTEFRHFSNLPINSLLVNMEKPIIGYYGAIAEWFDTSLVEYIALQRPEWSIVLIGQIASHIKKLKEYKNIYFIGEKPYAELPKYLYWFDVCMIPFKINKLTLSTNPVKFYEFISSGKPVVSTMLPELLPYSQHIYLSQDKEMFLKNIELALKENNEEKKAKRIELAKKNDWDIRFSDICSCIQSTYAPVSIIVVTYNNINYTKLCIDSIYGKTAYPNFELMIIDNASSDGTQYYLNSLKEQYDNLKIIFNKENLGFAAANNIGIKESIGEYIILLNNDTIVTRGWISGLIKYLKNPEIGMVGPVTNSTGNEAKINVNYKNLSEMEAFADRYTAQKKGKTFEISVLAMYCVALSRHTIEKVGLLDEQFAGGMFEDDDYALRVRKAGMKILCAEDVFIHHFGGATFSKLKSAEYKKLFLENKRKYEMKWGIKWQPHKYRNGVI